MSEGGISIPSPTMIKKHTQGYFFCPGFSEIFVAHPFPERSIDGLTKNYEDLFTNAFQVKALSCYHLAGEGDFPHEHEMHHGPHF